MDGVRYNGILLSLSYYHSPQICESLPRDQWKKEVRQRFETSLAQIQFNVLDIVQGSADNENYQAIPPQFQGICNMIKFKSVGWRNVSVWGFFGLLLFAIAVSVASIKTEDEDLWLTVGARQLVLALRLALEFMERRACKTLRAKFAKLAH